MHIRSRTMMAKTSLILARDAAVAVRIITTSSWLIRILRLRRSVLQVQWDHLSLDFVHQKINKQKMWRVCYDNVKAVSSKRSGRRYKFKITLWTAKIISFNAVDLHLNESDQGGGAGSKKLEEKINYSVWG